MKVDTTTPTQPPSHWLAGVTLHTSLASHWWRGGTLDTWLPSHWSSHLHITPDTHLPHLHKVVADVAISFSGIDNGVTGRNERYEQDGIVSVHCLESQYIGKYIPRGPRTLGQSLGPRGAKSLPEGNLKVQGGCILQCSFYIKNYF